MAQVEKKFEVVGDLVLSGNSVRTIFEPLGVIPPVRAITIPGGVVLSGENVTIPSQQLSLSGSELTLSDGNTVDLALAIPEIDIQTLSLQNDIVTIARGNTIDLGDYKQSLTLSGTNLIISSGNAIDLSSMRQSLAVSGTELTISDGNTVDLGFLAEELDDQTLSLSGTTLTITNGNSVDLSSLRQDLDLQDTTLSISDGNTVDLSPLNQSLAVSGTDLSISDGNTVDLSPLNQSLAVSGTELTISDGNTVDLGFLAEELDNQSLSLSGTTLSLSNGGSVNLSTFDTRSVSPVFITNITNNNGLIEKSYIADTVPADKIISGVTVDDDSNLNVTVEWDGPDDDWIGEVYLNGQQITSGISQISSTRRFTATINNLDLEGSETVTLSGNGGQHVVPVTLLGGGPVITNVAFSSIPTYSGSQLDTFLDGDQVQLTITFDTTDVSSISLVGGNDTATGSVNNQAVTVSDNGDGTSTLVYDTVIDTTLTSKTQVPVKISAKNSFGTEGDEHTSVTTIPVRQGPEITDVTFGSYPGSQTELKDNDQIAMTVTFDTNNVSSVQLTSGGSYASSSQTLNITPNNLTGTTTITIDTSVTTAQDQSVRLRARTISGSYGNYHTSVNKVKVNNVSPTFSGYNVTYPAGVSALKDTESADVSLTISNVGSNPTYTYSAPRSEISIPNTTTYNQTKTVTSTDVSVYNISSNNYSVTVNRAENDKSATYSNVVKIVNKLPTLTVSGLPSVMRSGGSENTTVQTYQVTVTSDQQLSSFAMDAAASAGTLTGSWTGSNSNRTWKRNIQISDDDDKGTFNWTNVVAVNLSNENQTTLSSGGSYTIGGFVSRTLTMSALSRTRSLGTNVADPTNLTISETFRGSITFDNTLNNGATLNADISTGVDVTGKYTIVDSGNLNVVDHDGDTFFYLDRVAVNNNVSGTSVITVEETT